MPNPPGDISRFSAAFAAALAERLFWTVLDHLQKLSPGFSTGRRGKGLAQRFRRVIHVVDSSTIALNCFLHRLGAAPAAQGGRQAPCASGLAQSAATLRLSRISQGSRQYSRRNTSKHTTFETSTAMAGISPHKNQ